MNRRTPKDLLGLAVVCLGASALVTQLVLMREVLAVFSGNELVLGIVLGNWMLLTALGAQVGRAACRVNRPRSLLAVLQVLIAVVPVASVLALRVLRNVVFIRGVEIGVMGTVAGCFVLLAPYCLLTGCILTLASHVMSLRFGPEGIGRVYALDSLGGILGGAAFSLVLSWWLGHLTTLYFVAALNLVAAVGQAASLPEYDDGTRQAGSLPYVTAAIGLALLAAALVWDLDATSIAKLHPGQEIIYRANSPYGSLVVARSGRQYNFHENGRLLFSTGDREAMEQSVHYAMAQRPDARRALLVGGGVSGAAREVLRYGVEAVDYVELDPQVLAAGRRFLPENLDDPRIESINTDARLFLRQTDRRYDVILVDASDPSTYQANRYFTREFFAEARGRLTGDGVLSIPLGQYADSLRPERANLLATAHATLRQEFSRVLVVPAERVFLLASDGPLSTDIAAGMERKGVQAKSIRRGDIQWTFAPDRVAEIERALNVNAAVNTDFSPILCYYSLRLWISQFTVHYRLLLAVLGAIGLACLVRFRPIGFGVFAAGFAATALEVVLLMGLQVLYGSLYDQVGLVMTMFMLGLAAGAWLANRRLAGAGRRALAVLLLVLAVYSAVLPPILLGLGTAARACCAAWFLQPAVPLLALVLAGLVGAVFPVAGKAAFQTASATASSLYTADYLGAALGALLVSTLLIPLLGATTACLLTAGLCLAAVVALLWTGKSPRGSIK